MQPMPSGWQPQLLGGFSSLRGAAFVAAILFGEAPDYSRPALVLQCILQKFVAVLMEQQVLAVYLRLSRLLPQASCRCVPLLGRNMHCNQPERRLGMYRLVTFCVHVPPEACITAQVCHVEHHGLVLHCSILSHLVRLVWCTLCLCRRDISFCVALLTFQQN